MTNLSEYTLSFSTYTVSIIELIGVVTSLAYTILAGYRYIACWFFGIVSSLVYIYISYQATFYQDTIIQMYYLVMGIVGWVRWKKEGLTKVTQRKIQRLTTPQLIKWICLLSIGTALSGTLFRLFTDNAYPYADAFTTVFALAATWLQIKRYAESWLIFVVVDAVLLFMYFSKGYELTALLFGVYTCVATLLAIKWYRIWQSQMQEKLQ